MPGLAPGPDGFLYAACPSAVLKVGPDGVATTIAHPVKVGDCDEDYPDGNRNSVTGEHIIVLRPVLPERGAAWSPGPDAHIAASAAGIAFWCWLRG